MRKTHPGRLEQPVAPPAHQDGWREVGLFSLVYTVLRDTPVFQAFSDIESTRFLICRIE